MNEAFEAALLDASGRSLVHTFTPGRDAFFNFTEGSVAEWGTGTEVIDSTVTIDLSGVAAGTEVTLVLRLVNNDLDTSSSVQLTSFEIVSGGGLGPVSTSITDDQQVRLQRSIFLPYPISVEVPLRSMTPRRSKTVLRHSSSTLL